MHGLPNLKNSFLCFTLLLSMHLPILLSMEGNTSSFWNTAFVSVDLMTEVILCLTSAVNKVNYECRLYTVKRQIICSLYLTNPPSATNIHRCTLFPMLPILRTSTEALCMTGTCFLLMLNAYLRSTKQMNWHSMPLWEGHRIKIRTRARTQARAYTHTHTHTHTHIYIYIYIYTCSAH